MSTAPDAIRTMQAVKRTDERPPRASWVAATAVASSGLTVVTARQPTHAAHQVVSTTTHPGTTRYGDSNA
ncbi:hypothetical protein [Humibacter ginsengiterrae]